MEMLKTSTVRLRIVDLNIRFQKSLNSDWACLGTLLSSHEKIMTNSLTLKLVSMALNTGQKRLDVEVCTYDVRDRLLTSLMKRSKGIYRQKLDLRLSL